ncbi:MAG: NAD(P)-binding protein [Thermoplasmata archaeon]
MSDSVVVIGGGIAGVQAALDLANSSVHVYLVEKTPSLGGRMAQLDKTFPTNDCSTCILSPKLVATARHPNIDILINSQVVSIVGEAPNFKVKVLKYPRFLVEEKCTACGLCTEICPVERKSEFDMDLENRKAIYIPFPQAVPLKFTIDRRGTPPCQAACPAQVHAQGYIALIFRGKFKEALELHREYNPLPLICGRVCPHPCENECNRGELDHPIAIAALKRFMADYELEHREEVVEPFEVTKNKKIAIIGSGPAGLSTAYYLTKMGYPTTIFEALQVTGGMLAVGIPDYRLPKDILEAEIGYIKKKGVEMKLNSCFGKDFGIEDLNKKGYDAIFLGIGAHASKKLVIPGEDMKGVISGVELLRKVNLGKKVGIGKRIAVIGGGDVAIDAVRVAHRLGSEAFILYRRTRKEMPAHEPEIEETLNEGIEINYLVQPVKILGKNGKVVGIECVKMKLGEPDESGRRRPVPVKGSEFTMEVDTVMPAIGQSPKLSSLEGLGLKLSRAGTIIVDDKTFATNLPGVFAAGDAVSGPATVVKAVGAGRKAAIAIDAYLRGEDVRMEEKEEVVVSFEDLELEEGIEKKNRISLPELPPSKRKKNFKEVVKGLSEEKAVWEAERCLSCGGCSGCYQCIKVCEPKAIDFEQKEEIIELNPGSIIVATGYEQFDPSGIKEYGYDLYENVITALEFERMLSASGPTEGRIFRPSDGKVPKNITFIQCVGSRDENHWPYCSRVCCMYAIKEAMLAKEHESEINEVNILYMDMRTFGKGFEEYYVRGREEAKVNFIRGRVSEIVEEKREGSLLIRFEDTEKGSQDEIKTDMVVLSSALIPSASNPELAEILGINLDENGFFKERNINSDPIATSRQGIFVCGCAQGPKDIPDSVAQASAASARAIAFVEERMKEEVMEEEEVVIEEIGKSVPIEGAEGMEEPRIGVFVCNCGINIGSVVDVEGVAKFAEKLPGVVEAQHNLFTCAESTQSKIQEAIKKHELNRVIVAACTPRTHEPLFRDTCEKAGLNPYLFEMANIREHCSWVHSHEKDKATEKAKDLIEMAVARSKLLEPLTPKMVEIEQKGLVIGGGIAGIQAALDISKQGFPTFLVEKKEKLGGRLNELVTLSPSNTKASELLKEKLAELGSSDVQVFKNTDIVSIDGFVGNFDVKLRTRGKKVRGKDRDLKVGAIVMAIGGELYEPKGKFSFGKYPNIITNLELERLIAEKKTKTEKANFAFILCVGAREKEGNTGCSRYCCQVSIKQAKELVENGSDVTILYRDIRTFGKGAEEMYKKASELGVKFVRYSENKPPKIEKKGKALKVYDTLLQEELHLCPDYVVLVVPMAPPEDAKLFQDMLKIPRGADGFFLEQHPKLAPLQTNTVGIFISGTAQGPKNLADTIAQASGAASQVIALLSNRRSEVEAAVAKVDDELCWGCGTCIDVCEFGAPQLVLKGEERKVSQINEALCKGCGMCAVDCPSGALSSQHFTREQILSMIEAFGGNTVA